MATYDMPCEKCGSIIKVDDKLLQNLPVKIKCENCGHENELQSGAAYSGEKYSGEP